MSNIRRILYFYTNKTFPETLQICFQRFRVNNFLLQTCYKCLRE